MGTELKNLKVKILSLVDKAANLRELVWKSESFGAKPDVNFFCEIKKTDDEKHLVYCPVYIPMEKDAHDDWASADTIEKAAHDFLAESKTYAVDTNHNMELAAGCAVVESAILKGTHSILTDEKEGTWYVAVKIDNEEIWKGVKDGTYTGISLYGFATRAEAAEDDESEKAKVKSEKSFLDYMRKFFTRETEDTETAQLIKDFNDELERMDFMKLSDAFWSVIYDIFEDENITDKKAAVLEAVDQMRTKIESMSTAKSLAKSSPDLRTPPSRTNGAKGDLEKITAGAADIKQILAAADKGIESYKNYKKVLKQSANGGQENKENKMETIEKTKYDADIAAKDAEIEKLKGEKTELEQKSQGSKQVDGDDKKEPVKKIFNWGIPDKKTAV